EAHGRERVAGAIESVFADVARLLVAGGVGRLVVAGGETSGAVVESLNIETLDIGPEIAPGVPALLTTVGQGGKLALALKSGNFGGPDFFAEADAVLLRPAVPREVQFSPISIK